MEVDGIQAFQAIQRLLVGELPIDYAGYRLAGEPADAQKDKTMVACAGVWPHPARTLQLGDVVLWEAAIGRHHYQLMVRASQQLGSDHIVNYQQQVLHHELRTDTVADQSDFMARWEGLQDGERWLILATVEAEAREHGLPVAFLLFSEVVGSRRPYVQLWHSQYLPSQVALEAIRYLYREHVARRNN